jgi:hypothetical protein
MNLFALNSFNYLKIDKSSIKSYKNSKKAFFEFTRQIQFTRQIKLIHNENAKLKPNSIGSPRINY